MLFSDFALRMVIVGVGATIFLDLWAILAHRLFGLTSPNWGLVGRWIGHMPKGRWFHASIAAAPPIASEKPIGWGAHYAIGIFFAALLLALAGRAWWSHPTLLPALVTGIVTVAAPYFILQPAMGAGVAASKTPHPVRARWTSLLSHMIFGLGLYVSAMLAARLMI